MEEVIIEMTARKATAEEVEYAEKVMRTEKELEAGKPFEQVMKEIWG